MSLNSRVRRWQNAGVIDAQTAERILSYEKSKYGFGFGTVMLGIGALAIVLGFSAIVSSNWDAIPAYLKLTVHAAINLILAVGIWYGEKNQKSAVREILLFVLAGFTLTFIALIGQIYQTGAPLWMALTLWMAIVSPFLFMLARAKFTIICWTAAFFVTIGSALEPIGEFLVPLRLMLAFAVLIPSAMLLVGNSAGLNRMWPVWPSILSMAGYGLIAAGTSFAQFAWHHGINGPSLAERLQHAIPALVVGLICIAVFHKQRLASQRNSNLRIMDIFLLASLVFSLAPQAVPHNDWGLVGAIIFMLYWALVGWTGAQSGYRGILNASVVIISIRLVIVYIELFGSLLLTGVGLMVSGVLLIALVSANRKLMQRLGRAV